MVRMLTDAECERRIIHARVGTTKSTLCGLDINVANDTWEPYHIWLEPIQFRYLRILGTKCPVCERLADHGALPEPSPA